MTQTYKPRERSITQIVQDLSKDIPPAMLKSKTLQGTKIQYIPWHEATRLLDLYAPGWSFVIEKVEHFPIEKEIKKGNETVTLHQNKVVMIVSITIPAADGDVTRYASGNEDDVTSSYGDPFSNAESMALRRAAAKFGLGRHLYRG